MGDIEIDECDFCKEKKQVRRTSLKPSRYTIPNEGYLELHNQGDYFIIIKTCNDCGTPKEKLKYKNYEN